jgi:hypothetical protein
MRNFTDLILIWQLVESLQQNVVNCWVDLKIFCVENEHEFKFWRIKITAANDHHYQSRSLMPSNYKIVKIFCIQNCKNFRSFLPIMFLSITLSLVDSCTSQNQTTFNKVIKRHRASCAKSLKMFKNAPMNAAMCWFNLQVQSSPARVVLLNECRWKWWRDFASLKCWRSSRNDR